jgi:TonB family protein
MTHTVVLAFLALSLNGNPHIHAGQAGIPKPKPRPPTEQPQQQPKPPEQPRPQPPPAQDEPEDDEPEQPRPPPWSTPQNRPNTEDPVLTFIQQNMRPIESCYEIARGRSSRLQGEVVVEFDINADGYVEREQVTGNSTGDADLGGCILQVVKGWRFREKGVIGFTPTHVRHPFRFQVLQ